MDINTAPFSPKQKEFILSSTRKYNLAHGAVRSGKTVATLYRFMADVLNCPGSDIYIFGYSLNTIYRNIISLLFRSKELSCLGSLCTWQGGKLLTFMDKTIQCIGCGDEGALGFIQGITIDLCYCDELTLYPENVIDMIDTRLSREHSKLLASMNPKHPTHKAKIWIDKAEAQNPLYYALHFDIDDNIFLPEAYKVNIKENLSGLFYKRNYLGLWCMAEGAIYDFFDRNLHVRKRPPTAAEYFIAGVDYGHSSCFALVLIGVATQRQTQAGAKWWVEKEYYWDVSKMHRQKTNPEYVRDLQAFLQGYPIKSMYIDPSASEFAHELRNAKFHVVPANNDVAPGIEKVAKLMQGGDLTVLDCCPNLIREIEGYIWDSKKSEQGEDAPFKKRDHACDALRYAVYTHKVSSFDLDEYNRIREIETKKMYTERGGAFR